MEPTPAASPGRIASRLDPAPQRFLEVRGERAALLGREAGPLELWLWPLLVARQLRVELVREGRQLETHAAALELAPGRAAWTLEASALRARVEWTANLERPAVLARVRLETGEPTDIELVLAPALAPMWPAGLGGRLAAHHAPTGALLLSEELGRFAVLAGAPHGAPPAVEADHSVPPLARLVVPAARWAADGEALFVIAGAFETDPALDEAARRGERQAALGLARAAGAIARAEALWREMIDDPDAPGRHQTARRRETLARTARVVAGPATGPAARALVEGCAAAHASIEDAWVTVEGLGRGLVAGLAPAGASERPGFGWFFDGDALIAARALVALGDFAGSRAVHRFAASHQRADGKLMHELVLSANWCEWERDYPYAFYKADNVPRFPETLWRHVAWSGEVDLASELLDAVLAAVRFGESCLDDEGRFSNLRAGLGAVEAGPLADEVASDVFLHGLWCAGLAAAIELVRVASREELVRALAGRHEQAARAFESFWSESSGRYGFARTRAGALLDLRNAYVAAPLSLGVGDPARARATAAALNHPALVTDWGARMFGTDTPGYDPRHYNIGSVFPYLSGFVVRALFRHGPPEAAWQVLASQLALRGWDAHGHFPEHLVGDRASTPARGVPHQVFSAAAVLQSVLEGPLGLAPHAPAARLLWRPWLPPGLERLGIERLSVGKTRLALEARRAAGPAGTRLVLVAERLAGPPLTLRAAPLIPGLSRVAAARAGGEELAPRIRERPDGTLAVEFGDRLLEGRLVYEVDLAQGPRVDLAGHRLERDAPARAPRLVAAAREGDVRLLRFAAPTRVEAAVPLAADFPLVVEGDGRIEDGRLVIAPREPPDAGGAFPADVRIRPKGTR